MYAIKHKTQHKYRFINLRKNKIFHVLVCLIYTLGPSI